MCPLTRHTRDEYNPLQVNNGSERLAGDLQRIARGSCRVEPYLALSMSRGKSIGIILS